MSLYLSGSAGVYCTTCGLNLEIDLGKVVVTPNTKFPKGTLAYLRFQPQKTVNTPSNKGYSEDQCVLFFDESDNILLTTTWLIPANRGVYLLLVVWQMSRYQAPGSHIKTDREVI